MDWPRLVQAIRTEKGLTQRALAAKIGVTVVTVQNWEAGRFRPDEIAAKRLAEMSPPKIGAAIIRELPEELKSGYSQKMKVSREAYEELHAALDLIFERAGSTVIEKVTEMLTRYAGQFAGEKGT